MRSVCISLDGKKIISGSDDKKIRVWNVETYDNQGILEGHDDLITSVCISSDGKKIISGSRDNTIIVWNLEICK